MQGEYRGCGQAKNGKGQALYITSAEIEDCVKKSLSGQNISTEVAGTTDSEGKTDVKPVPGKCGKLLERGTALHEGHHSQHNKDLLKAYGKLDTGTGEYIATDEFTRIYNSAEDWWNEEVAAYGSETPFYEEVINQLNRLPCCNARGKGSLPRKVPVERYMSLWENSPFTRR